MKEDIWKNFINQMQKVLGKGYNISEKETNLIVSNGNKEMSIPKRRWYYGVAKFKQPDERVSIEEIKEFLK